MKHRLKIFLTATCFALAAGVVFCDEPKAPKVADAESAKKSISEMLALLKADKVEEFLDNWAILDMPVDGDEAPTKQEIIAMFRNRKAARLIETLGAAQKAEPVMADFAGRKWVIFKLPEPIRSTVAFGLVWSKDKWRLVNNSSFDDEDFERFRKAQKNP